MKENRRKCLKCGRSPASDPNTTLFRFPRRGLTNIFRCESWAKFCYPEEEWHSPEFQKKLFNEHHMLCNRHFKDFSFSDHGSKKKLFRFAVPEVSVYKESVGNQLKLSKSSDAGIETRTDKDADTDTRGDNDTDTDIECANEAEPLVEENYAEDATQPFSWEQEPVDLNDEVMEMEVENSLRREPASCGACGGALRGSRWWCVSLGYRACVECASLDAAGYWLRAPEGRPEGEVAALVAALRRELDLVTVKEEPTEEPEAGPGESESPDPLDLEAEAENPDNEKSRPTPAPEQVVPVARPHAAPGLPACPLRVTVVKRSSAPSLAVTAAKQSPASPLRAKVAKRPLILLRSKLGVEQALVSSSVIPDGRRVVFKRKASDQPSRFQPSSQLLTSRPSDRPSPSQQLPVNGESAMRTQTKHLFIAR